MTDGAATTVRVRPAAAVPADRCRPSSSTSPSSLAEPAPAARPDHLRHQARPRSSTRRTSWRAALHLWNGDWALGGLQNQASGYLFPMGPAFLARRRCSACRCGSGSGCGRPRSCCSPTRAPDGSPRAGRASAPPGAVLAGLTYMLSPRVLTTVGGLSGETLPGRGAAVDGAAPGALPARAGCAAGWRSCSRRPRSRGWVGRTPPWWWPAWCSRALLLVLASGTDAAATARRRSARGVRSCDRRRRCGGWSRCFLLGSYAPPFLDFIESADNTAGATGWLSSLRGTSHWVAFFPGGGGRVGGRLRARVVAAPVLVTTSWSPASGCVGLLQPGLWERRVLDASVLVGLAVLTRRERRVGRVRAVGRVARTPSTPASRRCATSTSSTRSCGSR